MEFCVRQFPLPWVKSTPVAPRTEFAGTRNTSQAQTRVQEKIGIIIKVYQDHVEWRQEIECAHDKWVYQMSVGTSVLIISSLCRVSKEHNLVLLSSDIPTTLKQKMMFLGTYFQIFCSETNFQFPQSMTHVSDW